jgi:DNA-binding SARP family transcriptional activator
VERSYLRTFGGFQLVVGATEIPRPPTLKACSLAAYLILSGGAAIGRERLLELLWPEIEPERGRANLKTALWSLRDVLRKGGCDPDAFLSRERSVVQWLAPTTSDATHLLQVDPDGPVEPLAEAVGLVSGEFLEGIFDEWVVVRREELSRRYDELVAALFRSRRTPQIARLLLQRDPYDSDAVRVLAEDERRAGRAARALDLLEAHRTALDELGEPLAPDLVALAQTLRAARRDEISGIALPFVGRNEALAWLEARTADNDAERRALVVGEPGIGKTSLVRTLVDRLRRAERTVHAIAALPHDARPFEPWSSLYEALTGTTLRAFLAAGSGAPDVALAAGLADALPTAAVLVLDDAHWLSGDAVAVLRQLAPQLRRKGVVPIVTTRPAAAATLRETLALEPDAELRLHPLTGDDLRHALDLTVDGDVASLADALHRRSDGVPLYAAHLLASLCRGGVLTRANERWRLARRVDADALTTETLRATIAGPLRALGEDAELVACALALEPNASDDALCTALGWATARFDAAVELLIRAEFLVERPGSRLGFTHDLVADVAAGLPGRRQRLALHRAFAAQIAGWPDREAPLWQARHLEALGESRAAASAYQRAGELALQANALHDGIARFDAALTMLAGLAPTTETHAQATALHGAIAQTAFRLGERVEALAAAHAAVAEARASGDRRLLARAYTTRALQQFRVDDGEAAEDADEAARLAREIDDSEALVEAWIALSLARRRLGDFDVAESAARGATELAGQIERWDLAVAALDRLVRLHTMRWRFDDALALRRSATAYARRAGPLAEGTVHDLYADVWFALERYDEALAEIALGERSLERADLETTRWRLPRWLLSFNLAVTRFNVRLASGDLDGAEAVLTWRTGYRRSDDGEADPSIAIFSARLLVERGDPASLREAAALVSDLPREFRFDQFHWSDRIELIEARIAAGLGELDARARLSEAFALLERDAKVAPLTADRAFAALAGAARVAGDETLAEHATREAQHYRTQRLAAVKRPAIRSAALRVV